MPPAAGGSGVPRSRGFVHTPSDRRRSTEAQWSLEVVEDQPQLDARLDPGGEAHLGARGAREASPTRRGVARGRPGEELDRVDYFGRLYSNFDQLTPQRLETEIPTPFATGGIEVEEKA